MPRTGIEQIARAVEVRRQSRGAPWQRLRVGQAQDGQPALVRPVNLGVHGGGIGAWVALSLMSCGM